MILGTLLFIFAASAVYWTSNMLGKVAFQNKIINYSKLINKFYGHRQVVVYEFMNLITNFGGIIVYQQVSNFDFKFSI
jgi:hypothetical protein